MKRSTDRVLTTHCGSLPRPDDLIDLMREKENGRPYDRAALALRARESVLETVRRQSDIGVAVVSDGEQSKSGFASYQAERFAGFSTAPAGVRTGLAGPEIEEFREYYDRYFRTAMQGAMLAPPARRVCTGPVTYTGQGAVQADIENLKAALAGHQYEEAFMPSTDPLALAGLDNQFYRTQAEYEDACIEATRQEYQA
ncbi:MAG: methionine synthase, partial [Chloroflexota bacterium]